VPPLAKRASGRWVAVNDAAGFERAAGAAASVEDVGRALALAEMARVSSGW
jgi:hypothetical protein